MSLAEIDRYDATQVSLVGDRAIVVGGSIAGIASARVLADAFKEVVVLERDSIPNGPATRDGAPQTRHPHVLLEAGRATLEDLFPGFCEQVLASGGLMIDFGTDMREYNRGGFLADPRERYPTYCASRALFEHVARNQLRSIENVELRGGRQVTEYLCTADASVVTGVRVRNGDTEETVSADFVVDATGRTSQTPAWLADHGYDRPPTDEITINVSYRSIRIERPPNDRRMRMIVPVAPRTRGAALVPIEDDRWEVIVQGIHDDTPPTDRSGLIKYTAGLPVQTISTLLKHHSWVSDGVRQYPYPASLRRRYEDLSEFPDGLVVTGDAIASFNPIYGQGMSVAALEAVCLHHALATEGLDAISGRFFDRASDIVDNVWNLVVGGDFAYPQTTGSRPAGARLTNWYMNRLIRRAQSDPALSGAFARVTRLEEPPTALLKPEIVWRVVRPTVSTIPPQLFTDS
ncbi:NAD(P)/FAD-dependent oxidoreductase [Salarchaeum sp. JOR-1]|uniref:NAD(P)/FAD-dependent oxidoreductase n=1 Tax=Salarchaeum sp. JOR-1 TaxID=2599399 RepID=UPI00119878B9|nr:FAD-dependent monooxygenase [Salarchaeum sp. JOR-1]QDX41292.1 FAD-dependent oxidoreductase [Salarchaeum sp. JOR-1]